MRVKLVGDTNSVQEISAIYDVKENSNYRLVDIIGEVSVQPKTDYKEPIVWKNGDAEVNMLAPVSEVTLTAYATKKNSAEYTPQVQAQKVVQNTTPKAEDFITNIAELPKGTEFAFEAPVNTSIIGDNKEVKIKVTYPDGTSETVTTTMNVVEAEKDIYPVTDTLVGPKVGYARVTLNKNDSVNFESGVATVYDVKISSNTRYADIYDKVKASPADGYTEVKWYKEEAVVKGTEQVTESITLTAKAAGNNATTYEPTTETRKVVQGTTPNASDFITNKSDLPKGTEFEFVGTVDTSEIVEKEVKIKVKYPDGTSEDVTATMNVVAKDKLAQPTIMTPKQGDTIISGTAEGANTIDIVITGADGNVRATISNKAVNPDGSFNVPVGALQDGDVVKVVAKADGKDSSQASATVGLELDKIKSTVADAEKVENLDTDNSFDKNLMDKISAAKDVITRAEDADSSNNPRQSEVDKAEAELKDALNKKDANDKVTDLEGKIKADPMQLPTDQEVKAAQDAIDKIEGSLEMDSSDFSQVKKELQDRLDLVEAIKKAEDALSDPDNVGKPTNQKDPVKEAVQAAKDALTNGETTDYQTIIEKIEQAVKELEQERIIVGSKTIKEGTKVLDITTSVREANVTIKINDIIVKNVRTDAFGKVAIRLETPLQNYDTLELIASKQGYLDGSFFDMVMN